MNKWISAMIVVLLTGLASLAHPGLAHAGQLAYLSIINQNTNERLNIWRHEGRHYVAGNPGDRYAIEVTNRTGGRLLSVVSVDGVNVINGATASPAQSGYVLDAGQPLQIRGWRKNMDEVAAFYFTRLPDSYAARTDRADNAGVIGIALFHEYVEPVVMQEQSVGSLAAAPAPMASARAKRAESADADSKLGTGHGERLVSGSRMTEFRRASSAPSEIISIHYDTYARLVARGIIPRSRNTAPVPFPGSFVPDPS